MQALDQIILGVYVGAMIVLFVMGNCSMEIPIFIFGAILAFIGMAAIIRQTR